MFHWNAIIRMTEYLNIWFESSVNYLQAREFANELRASTKASRNPTVWLEGSTGSGQNVNAADTSTVSEAYAKMLTIFIPLLVDEVRILLYAYVPNL